MSIETKLTQILADLAYVKQALHDQADAIVELQKDCDDILILLGTEEPPVTGVAVVQGPITPHTRRTSMQFRVQKKGAAKSAGAPKKMKAGDPAPVSIDFIDNGDQPITIMGTNTAGDQVDISAVATLDPPPTSSDPSKVSVDPPSGMSFAQHAVNPGARAGDTVTVTGGVKWNDGSVGPFTYTLTDNLTAGPANNVVVVPGTITTH